MPSVDTPAGKACREALAATGKTVAAVQRADQSWLILQSAASEHGISPRLLSAVGIRESGFRNVAQTAGCCGEGVFQIDASQHPGIPAVLAYNVQWAAGYAAGLLAANAGVLARRFPAFSPAELLQATAASYNFGTKNIWGNPATIDVGTKFNNYGANVLGLMACFPAS